MDERAEGEFLDQALTAAVVGTYGVRKAALTAIRTFMNNSETQAFRVCRAVDGLADSSRKEEQILYNVIKEEAESIKNG